MGETKKEEGRGWERARVSAPSIPPPPPPQLLGLEFPSESPQLCFSPRAEQRHIRAAGPSGEARDGATLESKIGPKESDLDGSAVLGPRPYRAPESPGPQTRTGPCTCQRSRLVLASGLREERAQAPAFLAPPTASPEPGRPPQLRPPPGWAGPCGWAGGRGTTKGTALSPPAEEGTGAGGSLHLAARAAGTGRARVRALRAGSRVRDGARAAVEARGLCAEMAAAAAAAAEEGMEPRALQYEQTLVSEAEPSLGAYAPGPLLLLTLGSARTGGLSSPQPSELGKRRLEG